jgi:hypothetical protein
MLLMTIATIALAQGPTPPPEKPKDDPNKLICEQRLKTGSRVNFISVCHTRAEWELIRTENRKVVERGQANRGLLGE